MEKVHAMNEFDFVQKEVLHADEYFREFHSLVQELKPKTKSYRGWDVMSDLMNIPVKLAARLQEECNISQLKCDDEVPVIEISTPAMDRKNIYLSKEAKKIPPKAAANLKTLQVLEKQNKLRESSETLDRLYMKSLKYTGIHHHMAIQELRSSNQKEVRKHPAGKKLAADEVLLNIKIYNQKLVGYPAYRKLYLSQEVVVYGSQPLTALRDVLLCPVDLQKHVEEGAGSQSTSMSAEEWIRENQGSGFFFIHETFYDDMRNTGNKDTSKRVRDWAASHPEYEIGPFQTAKMEEVTFRNLSLKLGYPYVYIHYGNCEHLFSFSDARLVHPNDPQLKQDYPIKMFHGQRKGFMCMACALLVPKWVTYNNTRTPEEPFFVCDACYKSFYFDNEGNKVEPKVSTVPYVPLGAMV